MLNQFYRFVLVNNSLQTITFESAVTYINVKMTGVIVTTATGKLAYVTLDDDNMQFDAGRSIATGGEVMDDASLCHSAEIDNTTNLYINLLVQVEVAHDQGTAADGTFDLYYSSGDATGELEVDASGYNSAILNKLTFIGSLTWHASGADDELMRSPAFTV